MRQKESKKWLYIVAAALLAALLWGLSREMPLTTETVEQPLENSFAG